MNIISKIYTSILTERIYNWAEREGKIVPEQAGFRKEYSTTDHIYTLSKLVSNCLFGNKRKKVYCAFVDFQKAFDTVDRNKLWQILSNTGISTKFLNALKAIYKTVRGRVRIGADLSEPIACPAGVKQGCKLSPILFSLMINEVAKTIDIHGRGDINFCLGQKL